jgi:uncharacterized membrane protein YhaH (DUF805 family)
MDWFVECMKRYAVFAGRASRREYWHFSLVYLLISVILSIFDAMIGKFSLAAGMGLLSGLFTLAAALPALGVSIRRLHDTGRSGWWLLITAVPLIGIIVLIVFLSMRGEAGDNRFGPVPPQAVV